MKKNVATMMFMMVVSLISVAGAQQNEGDKIPQFQAKDAQKSANIGKWAYFVSNDPLFAVFNIDETKGEAEYTTPDGDIYVAKSMKLKYIGDDKTGHYYMYQNDVAAGGLVWFLPKTKNGRVYWMYGGVAMPDIHYYGPCVRFPIK